MMRAGRDTFAAKDLGYAGRRVDIMLRLLVIALVAMTANAAAARDMKLTIYDDGASCPGFCDAHVVMNPADNGTANAFRPGSSRQAPQACVPGEGCTTCFSSAGDSCMTVPYRGGGPPRGTFDFTPAFYDANCARSDIPAALQRQCRALDRSVVNLGYQNRINCFAMPDHPKCASIIAAARAAQAQDVPKRERCLQIGQAAYNAEQNAPRDRRANACNYSDLRLGGSGGRTWRLLLPAACRPGTFVGRDGLDCCSGNVRFAASVHPECSRYFVRN